MKNCGFTLIEIIVVLVILAVLAASAIPSYLGYVEHSQKVLCDTTVATVSRFFRYNQMLQPTNDRDFWFERAKKDATAKCPKKGEYICARKGFDEFVVYCTYKKHESDSYIGETYYFTNDIIKDMQENKDKYSITDDWMTKSNDELTKKILEHYDFGKLVINGKELTVEPYYDTTSGTILVFAKNDYDSNIKNWNANYLYNPSDGKWYTAPPGTDPKKSSIGIANTKDEDTYKKMTDLGWVEVAGADEVRATKK